MDDELAEFFPQSDDAGIGNMAPAFDAEIESDVVDGAVKLHVFDGGESDMISVARPNSWSNEHSYLQQNSDDACSSDGADGDLNIADPLDENQKNDSKVARFVCDFVGCGRTYCSLGNLRMHQRTHRGELKYQCAHPGCGKCFLTSYRLKVHVRAHTKEKPYKCESCEKSFNTLYRLKAHQRIHSGQTFHCNSNECGRSFTTKSDLKKHQRVHTGEKPFVCSVCDKRFAASHHLKVHVRGHTGEKPFLCSHDDCDRSFRTPYALRNHEKSHEGAPAKRIKSENGLTTSCMPTNAASKKMVQANCKLTGSLVGIKSSLQKSENSVAETKLKRASCGKRTRTRKTASSGNIDGKPACANFDTAVCGPSTDDQSMEQPFDDVCCLPSTTVLSQVVTTMSGGIVSQANRNVTMPTYAISFGEYMSTFAAQPAGFHGVLLRLPSPSGFADPDADNSLVTNDLLTFLKPEADAVERSSPSVLMPPPPAPEGESLPPLSDNSTSPLPSTLDSSTSPMDPSSYFSSSPIPITNNVKLNLKRQKMLQNLPISQTAAPATAIAAGTTSNAMQKRPVKARQPIKRENSVVFAKPTPPASGVKRNRVNKNIINRKSAAASDSAELHKEQKESNSKSATAVTDNTAKKARQSKVVNKNPCGKKQAPARKNAIAVRADDGAVDLLHAGGVGTSDKVPKPLMQTSTLILSSSPSPSRKSSGQTIIVLPMSSSLVKGRGGISKAGSKQNARTAVHSPATLRKVSTNSNASTFAPTNFILPGNNGSSNVTTFSISLGGISLDGGITQMAEAVDLDMWRKWNGDGAGGGVYVASGKNGVSGLQFTSGISNHNMLTTPVPSSSSASQFMDFQALSSWVPEVGLPSYFVS